MIEMRMRYIIGLVIVALAGFVIYRGQQQPIQASTSVVTPTLTMLPEDWARLTRTPTATAVAIVAVEMTNTPLPPTPTSTAVPPTASPTLMPTATNLPPTATPVPTIPPTLGPAVEEEAAPPEVNPLLLTRPQFDGPVNKTLLNEQVRATQVRVNDLVFILNEVALGNDLDCPKAVPAYEFIETLSPKFNVGIELLQANQAYDRGVERAITSLHPLYQACLDAATNGSYRSIPAQALDPDAFEAAFNQRLVLTAELNDALLWLNAAEDKLRAMFLRTRASINALMEHLSHGTTDRCDEITSLYSEIVQSPRLVVPEGRRLEAYLNYIDSIQFVEQGSASINLHCKEELARNGGAAVGEESGLPLPPDLLDVAQRLLGRSMTAIIAAQDALQDEPLVTGRLLETRPGVAANTFELSLRVRIDGGVPPYTVTVGGFSMDANNILTVVHTCFQDFFDNIIVVDSIGQRFESAKISVRAGSACQ